MTITVRLGKHRHPRLFRRGYEQGAREQSGRILGLVLIVWSLKRLPRAMVFSTASTGLLTPFLRSLPKLDGCESSAQGIPAPRARLQQDRRNVRSPAFSLQRGALNRACSGHHHPSRTQRAGRLPWRSEGSMGVRREGEDKDRAILLYETQLSAA